MQTPEWEEVLYNLCAVINHYSRDHNSIGHYEFEEDMGAII